jgi:hypothetical protein
MRTGTSWRSGAATLHGASPQTVAIGKPVEGWGCTRDRYSIKVED